MFSCFLCLSFQYIVELIHYDPVVGSLGQPCFNFCRLLCLCSFFFGFCQQILKLLALIMLLDGVLLIFNLVLPVVELMVYYASIWWRHRWYGHILFIYFGYVFKLLFRFPVEVKLGFIHLQTFRWLVAFTLIKRKRKKQKGFLLTK